MLQVIIVGNIERQVFAQVYDRIVEPKQRPFKPETCAYGKVVGYEVPEKRTYIKGIPVGRNIFDEQELVVLQSVVGV